MLGLTEPGLTRLLFPRGGGGTVTSSDNTLVIEGSCEIGVTVTLGGNDSPTASCTNGTVQFTITKTTDGSYNFTLSQTDRAGNATITAATIAWTRDTTVTLPPTPTINHAGRQSLLQQHGPGRHRRGLRERLGPYHKPEWRPDRLHGL